MNLLSRAQTTMAIVSLLKLTALLMMLLLLMMMMMTVTMTTRCPDGSMTMTMSGPSTDNTIGLKM